MKIFRGPVYGEGAALDDVKPIVRGTSALVTDVRRILRDRLKDVAPESADRLSLFIVATAETAASRTCDPTVAGIAARSMVTQQNVQDTLAWSDDMLRGYANEVDQIADGESLRDKDLTFDELLDLMRHDLVRFTA